QARGDRAARRVDVDGDVLFRVLGLEKKKLGNDQIRDGVVDGLTEKYDVVFQEAGVDVVGALTAARLLDHHWDKDHSASSPGATAMLRSLAPNSSAVPDRLGRVRTHAPVAPRRGAAVWPTQGATMRSFSPASAN